jgi:hypothetical protein
MMDERRLDTGAVIASGVLLKKSPSTDIPTDRESADPRTSGDWGEMDTARATADLEGGKLLDVPEYYGCVYAWKDEHGYHGRLMQYRSLSERPDFATAAECIEWFERIIASVAG